ncbi:MAG: DUF423 domain-containing protein [Saprospiraceae bacterium]
MNTTTSLRIAAIVGASAIALGAFGAHGLKPHLDAYQLDIYKTGVLYHMMHSVALLVLAFKMHENTIFRQSFVLMLIGVLLFSGSLYLLATKSVMGIDHWSWLGPLTPIGGLCFILGWVNLVRVKTP